eukprot:gene20395-24428_t
MADDQPEEVKMSEGAPLELETEVAEDELVEEVEDPPEGAEADEELKAAEADPDYFGLESKPEEAAAESAEPAAEALDAEATDPADDPLKKPPHSSEVFIGGIPRSLTDEELEEICKPLGEVHEIRLLKDSVSAGQNRGYAFVAFTNKADAAKAIESLNNAEVRATLSSSKHRLFVGNIPKDMTKEQVIEEFSKLEPGVEEVELKLEPGSTRSRGYAFVEFYNTAVAERARQALTGYKMKERLLTVSWAKPPQESAAPTAQQTAAAAQVKSLYIKGVVESVTEAVLKEIFEKHGEIEKIVFPRNQPGQPRRDFCFVHFKERAAAVAAAE